MEVIGRVESGTETENESGDRVEARTAPQGQASRFRTIPVHSPHPCGSDSESSNIELHLVYITQIS